MFYLSTISHGGIDPRHLTELQDKKLSNAGYDFCQLFRASSHPILEVNFLD